MITRLVCLLFALAIIVEGLWEESVGLMMAGSCMVALAFTGLEFRGRRDTPATLRPNPQPPDLSVITFLLLGTVLLLTVFNVLLTWGDTYSFTAFIFWLIAIGCLITMALRFDQHSWRRLPAAIRSLFAPQHRTELASIGAIVLVALIFRMYDLENVPPNFHTDEAEMTLTAVDVINGKRVPIFSTAPFFTLPFVFTYLQAGSILLFGPTVFGVRMLSVICGVLCIPIVYVIGRIGWGPVAAATAAWLLAVNALHGHYSRTALIVIETNLTAVLMMLLLVVACEWQAWRRPSAEPPPPETDDPSAVAQPGPEPLRPGMWTLIVGAGLMAGLSQYFYFAGRAVPIIAAPLLLYLWRTRRISFLQGVGFGLAFVVVYAPLAAHYVYQPTHFFGRLQQLSIFTPDAVRELVGRDASLPSALPWLLIEQGRRTLTMFVRAGDAGGFYTTNVPAFDMVTAALFWLGLGAVFSRPRRFHEFALLVWAAIGTFLVGAGSLGAPAGHRLLLMVPAACLFAGVLISRLWELLRQMPVRRGEWAIVPAGTAVALWLLATNVTAYFTDYVGRGEGSEGTVFAREMMKERPERYRIYFLSTPLFDPNNGAVRYIARGIPAANIREVSEFQKPPNDGRGILVIALANRQQDLKRIEAQVPGGTESTYSTPNGRLIYVAYRVPPSP